MQDDVARFDWSGVTIQFGFTGASLLVGLQDSGNVYNVSIDGTVRMDRDVMLWS